MRQKPSTRLEFTSVTNFIKSAVALDAELELLEFSERQKVSSLVLCIPSAKMTNLQRVVSEKGGYDRALFDDVMSALFCSLTRSNVAESLQLIKQSDSTIQEFNIEFKNAVKFLKMQDGAFAQLVLKTYKDSLSLRYKKAISNLTNMSLHDLMNHLEQIEPQDFQESKPKAPAPAKRFEANQSPEQCFHISRKRFISRNTTRKRQFQFAQVSWKRKRIYKKPR